MVPTFAAPLSQAQVEQKQNASRHLLNMNIDSVRRELEAAARAIQQKDHTELLQQASWGQFCSRAFMEQGPGSLVALAVTSEAEAVAASSATKAVRESLHEAARAMVKGLACKTLFGD